MMKYKPIAPLDVGQNRDDVYTFARKYNEEIERIYDLLNSAGTGGKGDTPSGGMGILTFPTMAALQNNGVTNLDDGTVFQLSGYYRANDGGGAQYVCKYLWSASAYPWAIDLGATDEIEYELVYKLNGEPETDPETGAYVRKLDNSGQPIPVYDGASVKHKHLYAVITETTVNYRQFGAKLDGVTDDEKALRLCHRYQHDTYTIEPLTGRKRYYIRVENHGGIIHKANNDPIICSGNIDLSGSELLIGDENAAWFGFYLWGDNEEDYQSYEPIVEAIQTFARDNFVINCAGNSSEVKPNSLIFLKEDPYAVRDDSGYLYSEPRYELLLHTMDGLLTSPVTYDWVNPGGLSIQATKSNYETHQQEPSVVDSKFSISYTRLPATHYHFIGCDVKINVSANKYGSVLWCKCHNAHISGFTFEPDSAKMHNTIFKNTMIYLWGCYNVEVSDIVGMNAAGKKDGSSDGTSGYVIRATNCLQVHLHDISVQGYWGATAMNCVKDIHITRVNINRLDIHNYFYNLYIDQCNLFNHAIQIGEGRGICQITNSNFYINKLDADSYPNAHLLEFNLTYGRIFEGSILIQNCNAYLKDPDGNEFDVCKIEFSPEAVSTLDSYKFPEVTIRDCNFYSYTPNTYLVYFMVAGTRNCKTAMSGPDSVIGMSKDTGNDTTGTLVWKYIGRGVDWVDDGDTSKLTVVPGQVIRTYQKVIDSDKKTAFYNFHYFLVTAAGVLPTPSDSNMPSDYTGEEFAAGTAKIKHITRNRWEANRQYAVGDYCFTEYSSWFPLYCYQCTTAGKSNGYRPVHLSGTVIDGIDVYPANLDACYWQYTGTAASFISKDFTAGMEVSAGQVILADHRLYRVINSGTLKNIPPLDTAWLGSFSEGSAKLSFIGKEWTPKTWFARGSYCLSYGSDDVLQVYQLVDQDGTTSGSVPVPSNGKVVDGDMIWQNTTEAATKGAWTAQTQYFVGDIVTNQGHNYRCVFDGRLELPRRTTVENVSTNMTTGGDLFAFWENGTDVPTKFGSTGKWEIFVKDNNLMKFRQFTNGYFCHEGNPQPTIIDSTYTATSAITSADTKSY